MASQKELMGIIEGLNRQLQDLHRSKKKLILALDEACEELETQSAIICDENKFIKHKTAKDWKEELLNKEHI